MLSTKKERFVILFLALLQFTHVMDFMIIMPLNPILARVFSISSSQFSFLVAVFTLTGGLSSLFGAPILDKFDRKRVLLVCHIGFLIGTFMCAIAESYEQLLFARGLTGAFGGITTTMGMAIIGDIIPNEQRGTAISWIMSAFAVSSVLGMPLGIWLATDYFWSAPFYFVTLFGTLLLFVGFFILPKVRKHLEDGSEKLAFKKVFSNAISIPNQYFSLILTFLLVLGQFTLVPNIARYMVNNVEFTESDLKYIYLVGGGLTIFTTPFIGKLCDKFERANVFRFFVYFSFIPILLITHMGAWPMYQVLIVSGMFFVFLSGRFIPVTTIVTSAVKPNERAGFMSINTAFREFSAAISAILAGSIITDKTDGTLGNFEWIGYLAIASSIVCLFIVRRIKAVS